MSTRLQVGSESWLHQAVVVGPSSIEGQGLLAQRAISKDEGVEILGGRTLSDDEVNAMIDRGERYDGIVLGPDLNLQIEPADWPGIHGNHSCDPNLWMRDAVTVVARRDIVSGEELTADYALYTTMPGWSMKCNCGSPLCRGEISGNDWQRQELQERYKGHFAPAVTQLIQSQEKRPKNEVEEVVRRGYDAAAERYTAARDQSVSEHLEHFSKLLPSPATVLDIGCGAGKPVDRFLVDQGYKVEGIDVSRKQIELARRLVPEGHYEVKSMLDLKEREYIVDGIVSFYAIFHTPRESHASLLRTFASFVRPGGVILVTMGSGEWEGTEEDFHGVKMYWSHFGPAKNRELVEAAGFAVELDQVDGYEDERHQVILARGVDHSK